MNDVTETKRAQQGVQSVEIGLKLARALAEAGTSLPLGELAGIAGLPPSKAHRYLVSLCRSGLVEQDPSTGFYDLGSGAIWLGLHAQSRLDEFRMLDDMMRDLYHKTRQPLAAIAWGGSGLTIVRKLEGAEAIIVSARIGATLPIVGPSSGFLYAAFLPREVVDPFVRKEFAQRTKPSLSRREFAIQVQSARQRKLAATREGFIRGFDALSAPVFNAFDEIILTISMLAPTGTADFDFDGELARELSHTTDTMSRRLGKRDTQRAR